MKDLKSLSLTLAKPMSEEELLYVLGGGDTKPINPDVKTGSCDTNPKILNCDITEKNNNCDTTYTGNCAPGCTILNFANCATSCSIV